VARIGEGEREQGREKGGGRREMEEGMKR